MSLKARILRVATFTATRLEPDDPADGTSLEEQIQAWFTAAGEIEFLEIQYRAPAAGEYTALVLYTE